MLKPPDTPPPSAKPSISYSRDHRIWIAAGVFCPHCATAAKSSSVEIDRDRVRMICVGCHEDLLTIERN